MYAWLARLARSPMSAEDATLVPGQALLSPGSVTLPLGGLPAGSSITPALAAVGVGPCLCGPAAASAAACAGLLSPMRQPAAAAWNLALFHAPFAPVLAAA